MRHLLVLIAIASALGAAAAAPAPLQRADGEPGERLRPRLVVVISIDQMRADYIERYGHHWTAGLKRLLAEGARFSQAAYPYLNTVTCPGHATIGTGTFPATHGMVLNQWWDRERAAVVACTTDPASPVISHGRPVAGGHSAARLLVPTLADELRVQLPVRPKVVSLSLKPRSAIMLAGHGGDVVLWFEGAGGWSTSRAYATAQVPFARRVSDLSPIEADAGKVWTRLLPPAAYLFEDDAPGERSAYGWEPSFPHPLAGTPASPDATFYGRWQSSPYADDALGRLATAAIAEFQLGEGPGTDFLGVSFSSLDVVGHDFGPRSHEVQDVLARLDITLGRLLAAIDAAAPGRALVALTADHAVATIPEQARGAGLDAGRIDLDALSSRIEEAIVPHLGPGPHVAALLFTDVYFRPGVYEKLASNGAALRAVIDTIANTPGIARVVRGEDLAAGRVSADATTRAMALSYMPGRSGDLIVAPRPGWISSPAATTHGTSNLYDQRVPLVLRGAGIRPGEYLAPASPADIAPTLAWFAGVTMSRTDGRVLTDAINPTVIGGPPVRTPAAR